MPRHSRGYNHLATGEGEAYCEALEALREHCEQTDQSYMRVMIDLIGARLREERDGRTEARPAACDDET